MESRVHIMDILANAAARAAADNIAEEAKRKAPTKKQIDAEAAFLKTWAGKKPVRRMQTGSTFWASGKNMTKIDYKMAQALADAGYATLNGDPRKAGCVLTMKGK